MKLYRDLTEGEVLQPGDLYRLRNSDMDWCEHTEDQAAEMPDATVGIIGTDDLEWRRPVDAVPREQYDKVSLQLAEERVEHGRTAHGRDTHGPPLQRRASPHAYGEVRESLIQDGRFALRKAIEKLFRAGLTHAEVSREVQAVMEDSGVLF